MTSSTAPVDALFSLEEIYTLCTSVLSLLSSVSFPSDFLLIQSISGNPRVPLSVRSERLTRAYLDRADYGSLQAAGRRKPNPRANDP